ncbi:DUF4232 domain-containing protein [Streptomyces sp. NPDC017254]|uniref:DUF4232 domain-containing protein n=1 Tax=unclassified Streptomyces TaxID=2593676 RepID=UPI00378CE30A
MPGRTARTRLFAVTTIAIAALSLTACGAGAAKDEGAAMPSVAPTPSAASTTQPAETPTTAPTTAPTPASTTTAPTTAPTRPSTRSTPTRSDTTKDSGSKHGSESDHHRQCGAGNTKIIATPVSRPLNHLLLTVTNTGSAGCDLLDSPIARFDEAQSVPPVDESTHPQAVVTLAPGESGYAGVLLSAADGSGTHGLTATSLTVGFSDGSTAKPRLGGKGVYVDSSLRVTYWQHSLAEALN